MNLQELTKKAHENASNKGFWESYDNILKKMELLGQFTQAELEAVHEAFLCQKLLLIHNELSEAVEALRSGDQENFKVELGDVLIRTGDTAGMLGLDLNQVVEEKMSRNSKRPKLHGRRF